MRKFFKPLIVFILTIILSLSLFTTACTNPNLFPSNNSSSGSQYEDDFDGDSENNTGDGTNEDNNDQGSSGSGSGSGDNQGSTGGNTGSGSNDNQGSSGSGSGSGDNQGSTGGNTGSGSDDNQGSSGSGSGSGDNQGSSGGNTGSGSDDNQGSSGSGSGSGDNQGSSGSGAGSGDNQGSTGGFTPQVPLALTFAEKTTRYLNGATINDTEFINYYKILGEYNFNAPVVSNAIYASPNGNGNGTKNKPYSLQDALDSVSAGQTLYLLEGTYTASEIDGFSVETQGTKNAYITIRNYPGATVKITNNNALEESYGLQIGDCCYTVIEGIEISYITAYNAFGIAIWGNGQNHLIFRNLNIHHIVTNASDPETEDDSSANALLINGEETSPVSNVIIANCSMHDNVTGWAETLSVAGNCEYVYVLENNVSNNTNIGIDFYGNAKYCLTPSLDQPRYCVASGNYVSNSTCGYADCAGLYVDGARDIILQYNTITESIYGIEVGSEELQADFPVENIIVRNNLILNNLKVGIRVGGYEAKDDKTGIVYNVTFANNTLINNGYEIIIAKVDGIKFVNNLIKTTEIEIDEEKTVVIKTDFSATDCQKYCKNITFTNNYISVATKTTSQYKFYMYGTTQTGVSAFQSKTGATVITGQLTLDSNYVPSADSVVINNGVQTEYGDYDYRLLPRLNDKIDIGAFEL